MILSLTYLSVFTCNLISVCILHQITNSSGQGPVFVFFSFLCCAQHLVQLLLLFSCLVVSDSCDPVDCSTPDFPVLHYLWEFFQVHVHWVADVIQPSHPLLPSFPFAFSLSPHQGLFLMDWLFVAAGQSTGASNVIILLEDGWKSIAFVS